MPDIIAGCSVGAVVGGCHAAGKLDAVEDCEVYRFANPMSAATALSRWGSRSLRSL
ncbi:hypothetical protein AEGHOMDF_3402 [Methylobacterium soli]|nr:hypothetical protein AEGHOMDF_3402 [Methylobacterium soli]